jgi:6-phosphofructokinase 1
MKPLKGNCIIAQSGGPTAVINSSIAGAIHECLKHKEIKGIYGAINGILGVLSENIVDLRKEKPAEIDKLRKTPSSALGSCRHKLKEEDLDKILSVFRKYNVRYFFCAGGNDSMDTANKVSKLAQKEGYELRVMGIPKTVDNDLPVTDHCPGYGSVARWLAISVRDAGLDTEAIYTSDTVKIIETMGRNAGWITASTALAKEREDDAPNLIYLPERPFDNEKFLQDVDRVYKKLGHVLITVCEGLKNKEGEYLTASRRSVDTDGFGHKQLGGVGDYLCDLIAANLKIKARFDKPGTIQRVSSVCASRTDLNEAYLVGKVAVRKAVSGMTDMMVTLVRAEGKEYRCFTGVTQLENIANKEKKVPDNFINADGNFVTEEFLNYVKPLIGSPLPEYARLRKYPVRL